MKGTILDFLKLATEKPELAKDLLELANKHDFEFTVPDEVSDEELDGVSGGLSTRLINPFSPGALSREALWTLYNVSVSDANDQAATQDAMSDLSMTAKSAADSAKAQKTST